MKKWFLLPVCLWMISLIGIKAAGPSGYSLGTDRTEEKQIPAGPGYTIEVENISGSIEITGWKNNQVKIHAQLGEDVKELKIEDKNDRILIKVELPRNGNINHGDAILKIQVPDICHRILVDGISADITISGTKSKLLTAKTISGDVDYKAESESAELSSISGDVEFSSKGKNISVETTSGDIIYDEHDDLNAIQTLQAKSISGDIAIEGSLTIENGQFHTTSGDIELQANIKDPGSINIKSLSGEIELTVPPTIPALFEVSSFSGEIDDRLFNKTAKETSDYTPEKKLRFGQGKESIRITIESFSGDISLNPLKN